MVKLFIQTDRQTDRHTNRQNERVKVREIEGGREGRSAGVWLHHTLFCLCRGFTPAPSVKFERTSPATSLLTDLSSPRPFTVTDSVISDFNSPSLLATMTTSYLEGVLKRNSQNNKTLIIGKENKRKAKNNHAENINSDINAINCTSFS